MNFKDYKTKNKQDFDHYKKLIKFMKDNQELPNRKNNHKLYKRWNRLLSNYLNTTSGHFILWFEQYVQWILYGMIEVNSLFDLYVASPSIHSLDPTFRATSLKCLGSQKW